MASNSRGERPRETASPLLSSTSAIIPPGDYFVDEAQVAHRRNVSRRTHQRDVVAGRWPPAVSVSRRRKAWLNSVVERELANTVIRSEEAARAKAQRQPT